MEKIENKNIKILIVDDQQQNIQVLGSLLREENYIIGVAMNGQQALEVLQSANDYDLVLLDINMPIMDGLQACQEMRKIDSLKDIPVIFLTALAENDNIVKGFEVGGQDYVTKPFQSKELLARVRTQIELKRSRDLLKQLNKTLEVKVAERTNELHIANEKLLHLDNAKSEFLNIISHEIRTPLNGIMGVLSVMNEYELPDEVMNMLDLLEVSSHRLQEFSIKVLEISYFNTLGDAYLKVNKSDVNKILRDCVSQYKERAAQKGMIIETNFETEDAVCTLDESFIYTCINHIIDNAVKFGNRESKILISEKSDVNEFKISIENQGPHLPESFDFSNIQPFNTQNHVNLNPALSLYLCKQIVLAHNGSLMLENTKNGVQVKIFIPKRI